MQKMCQFLNVVLMDWRVFMSDFWAEKSPMHRDGANIYVFKN